MRVTVSLASAKLPAGLTPALMRQVVRESCRLAAPEVFQPTRRVSVEVAYVSDRAIQTLNHTYRRKNRPTDVLSFGNVASRQELRSARATTLDLGTLVLSLPFIRRSARADGVSWKREWVYVFSHGILHLLGFDHEAEMFRIQDRVTDRLAPLPKTHTKSSV